MIIQQILPFQDATDRRCGNCVVWNGRVGDISGGCSRLGWRGMDDTACEDWFGIEQMRLGRDGKPLRR